MKVREINEFEIIEIESSADTTQKIIIKNSKLKDFVEVIGGVLEAQYVADDNYILFVTEGNPLEEALYIYFLDSSLRIKDSLELSVDYASGIVGDFSIEELSSIKFSFFDKDDSWILTVFDSPRVLFFGNKYPVKRGTSIFLKSWLRLEKCTSPDKETKRTGTP